MRDPRRAAEDFSDAAHHSVRAGERSAGRQLDHRDQVSLVLVGDKAGRSAGELPAGEANEAGIDDESQHRHSQQPPGHLAVAERHLVEGVVEAAKEGRDRASQ